VASPTSSASNSTPNSPNVIMESPIHSQSSDGLADDMYSRGYPPYSAQRQSFGEPMDYSQKRPPAVLSAIGRFITEDEEDEFYQMQMELCLPFSRLSAQGAFESDTYRWEIEKFFQ